MKEKVSEAISRFSLLGGVHEVTVALSGGADSMSLLYVLLSLKDELEISVSAVHFNHHIRGAESDADEQFVKNVCKKLSVPLICGEADVPKYAEENHISTELAARTLRYEFFEKNICGLVATAHTASDNLETVLYNLTRGTALKGLCGIPPRRDKYIRPLILCTREDVENYCNKNLIEYVTDSTNLCDDYARNKIRHAVIPVLKQINPSAETAVSRTVELLSFDSEMLETKAKYEFNKRFTESKLLLDDFEKLDYAVAGRVIRMFFEAMLAGEIDNFHIKEIYKICVSGGRASIPDNKIAVSKSGKLSFFSNVNDQKQDFSVEITVCDNTFYKNSKKVNNLLLKNALDCDKIVGSLVTRTRIAGDSIRIKNRNCTKTVKKLFTEYSVPTNIRDSIPVIADDLGVVWIYGIGVSERCAVTKNTKKVYSITVNSKKVFSGDDKDVN